MAINKKTIVKRAQAVVISGFLSIILLSPSAMALSEGDYAWNAATGAPSCQNPTSSSTGEHTACAAAPGYIYTSSNYGVTWQTRTTAGSQSWVRVAISGDGQHLAGVVMSGSIWTSSDFGASWTERTSAGTRSWNSIDISSNGQRLVALNDSSDVYLSSDYGASWTTVSAGGQGLDSVSMSSNGQHIVASDYGATTIVTSSDYGATWTQAGTPAYLWSSVAISPNGQHIVAAGGADGLYVSHDYGVTWALRAPAGYASVYFVDAVISADGQRLITGDISGTTSAVYVSFDGGLSWEIDNTAPASNGWGRLAGSDDLNRVIIMDDSGQFYNATFTPAAPTTQPGVNPDGSPLPNPGVPNTGYESQNPIFIFASISAGLGLIVSSVLYRYSKKHR